VAYPPAVPAADITNTTPQVDRHPLDHNAITEALRDILNELGIDPKGAFASLTARMESIRELHHPVRRAAPVRWRHRPGRVGHL
jgi:hypothetical protein